MRKLLKNWKVLLLLVLLVSSIGLISAKGINFGIDFEGGTLFTLELSENVKDSRTVNQIKSTIQQRLDWTGLRDTRVNVLGNDSTGYSLVEAQIGETDPIEVEKLESLLLKQGKFEIMLDGNVMITGNDILQVITEPSKGYNYRQEGNAYLWTLPFSLTDEGARKFAKASFHQCQASGFRQGEGVQYLCKNTYFFIDRPSESVIIIPAVVYEQDSTYLLQGNLLENFSEGTQIDELLLNTNAPYFVVSKNLKEEQLNELRELSSDYEHAIIHPLVSDSVKEKLEGMQYTLNEIEANPNQPWVWKVSGAKNVIRLTESVTNDKPFVKDFEDAKILSSLMITGYADTAENAQESLSNLVILLESGSLPVPVSSVSKEIITPVFGEESLNISALIGLIALVVVALVLFFRYRMPKIIVPILITGLSEVILILGFASLINWRLDLASIAGLLAVVGTGVDDQIIITDELIKGEIVAESNVIARIKKAFFIIVVAAATTIATMLPIVLFGFGLGKLVGFAITTIAGVLIGVFVTRPAFGEMMRRIIESQRK